jgi:hypothetical protein
MKTQLCEMATSKAMRRPCEAIPTQSRTAKKGASNPDQRDRAAAGGDAAAGLQDTQRGQRADHARREQRRRAHVAGACRSPKHHIKIMAFPQGFYTSQNTPNSISI